MTEHEQGREPLCPDCLSRTAWDKQDVVKIGEARFTERVQICLSNCGWIGAGALFPWRGVEKVLEPSMFPHGEAFDIDEGTP